MAHGSTVDITNELNTIRDTHVRHAMQAILDELLVDMTAIKSELTAMKTIFDAHTHNADGAQAGAYYTSPPRSDAATVSAGVASAFASPAALNISD